LAKGSFQVFQRQLLNFDFARSKTLKFHQSELDEKGTFIQLSLKCYVRKVASKEKKADKFNLATKPAAIANSQWLPKTKFSLLSWHS
jgi:hypothetical protein